MTLFTPYLLWHNGKQEVNSLAELDALLDALATTSQDFSVELCVNNLTALSITVGSNESHVEFYSEIEHPPVSICKGNRNADGRYLFLHQGEPSSVWKRDCVPIEMARAAMREYFLTKARPNNIPWY
jgi:hypothetical protein